MSAQLHPIIHSTNLRSTQLDVMVTMFKFVCPVTIKVSNFEEKKEGELE